MLTHNQRYEEAQKNFLEARKQKDKKAMNNAFVEMYKVLVEIERRYISKYCVNHNFLLDDLSFDEKVDSAVFYILDQYQKPDWKIEKVSAYACCAMKKALFLDMDSSPVSLNQLIEANNDEDFASDNFNVKLIG